jgi:NAD(P)-dependent dehydrogenase (short-subunit alcohol dehydrogenase family)
VVADLRALAGCEAIAAGVRERCKRCDILVNNAGATQAGDFLSLPDAAWIDGYALKFFGCVRMTRLLWRMLKEAQGHVVNIIGIAARTPGPDFLIGGSVNAAMANFSKGLAQLGKRDGVNVNVIHPGATDTERTHDLLAHRAAASGRPIEELHREMLARDGLRRLGHPDDIAALALFLCSERARHIQGTAIAVDGGATPGLD